jgi:hypothetical protein
LFFEKINKIDKSLTKMRKENTQTRNEKAEQKSSIKYCQTKFNSILKRSYTMINLVSSQGGRDGSTYVHHEICWVPVAHAYNPRYSGGRDQEDHGLKSAQEIVPSDPILKKTLHKKRLIGWLKV